jgi:phytoene dehydrogenase-like protein
MARKPHAGNAGFVCERKARLGGHIVVYDRKRGCDVDAGERWIVMHEPSSRHVAIQTEATRASS